MRHLLLSLLMLLAAPAFAQDLAAVLDANRDQIERPSRQTIAPVIEALAAAGPQAGPVLEAWADRRLGLSGDRFVIVRGDEALDAILELADSRLTYRRRYSVELWRHAVLDLSVLDPLNPRSVTFLAEELDSIIHALPGFQAGEPLTQPGRRIARLAVRLRTADPREVDAAFLKRVAQDMRDISELLSERYFAPASGHLSAYGGSTVE